MLYLLRTQQRVDDRSRLQGQDRQRDGTRARLPRERVPAAARDGSPRIAPPGLGPLTPAAVVSGQRLLGNRIINRMMAGAAHIQRMTVPLPSGIQLTGGAGVSVVKNLKGKHISVTHKQVQNTKDGKMIPLTGFHYTNESNQAHWYWNNEASKTKFNMGINGNPGTPARQGGGVYRETAKQAKRFGIELEDPTPAPPPAAVPAAKAEAVEADESEDEEAPAPATLEKVKDAWDDED
jgi:hypothetical protein